MNLKFKENFGWWAILITVIATTATWNWYVMVYKNETKQPLIFTQPGRETSFSYGANPELSKSNFFKETKQKMIDNGVDFIEANLSEMKVRAYKDGEMTFEAPIKSKGRVGSWWETPAGIYQAGSVEKNHFSSFGQVYMPYSVQFQGNFFIHGWPYYPSGEPVAEGYSGGCVRLEDQYAKVIYEFANRGMPILVFEEDFMSDDFTPVKATSLNISAKNYLVADLKSSSIYLDKNRNEVVPVASITKLMTALVAAEYVNLEKEIVVNKDMIIFTSKPRLKAGQTVTPFDLMYPLLQESSNEAAEALAGAIGRDLFIRRMNEKAVALGMSEAEFEDPSGQGEGNRATTEDLFNLARYLVYNRSFILDISAGRAQMTAYGRTQFDNLDNFNDFGEDGFVGGKVGQTRAAGETALMIYKMDINGQERQIAIVVLGSEDREKDVKEILSYLRSNY